MIRRSFPFLLSLATFLVTSSAPTYAQSSVSKTVPWKKQIDTVLSSPAFKNASVGVYVRSLDTGKVLYQQDIDRALIPASNEKLLTAAVALARLGPGFTFSTVLRTTGNVERDGTLHGDIYLVGSGDPSLTTKRLDELAKALAATGVKRLVGRIVGDGTAFDNRILGEGWEWDDEPYYYQPQVSGLNCDENVVSIGILPGAKVDDTATVTINGRPADTETYLTVESTVQTVAAGKGITAKVEFDRARGQNRVVVTGTIPVDNKPVLEDMTVEDPAKFAASRFVLALAAAGITVETPLWIETGTTPDTAREIGATLSKPLPELLKDFLKPSDNLYGETLLKAVGRGVLAPKQGTTDAGAALLHDFLKASGIPADGVHTADGSGLSRRNTVTPRLICDLLTYVDKRFSPDQKAIFMNALPTSGVDGTLRNRFKGTPIAGKLKAKTGTLSGVSSLSGYLTTKSGERLAFSILMNNFGSAPARATQDAIITALYNQNK